MIQRFPSSQCLAALLRFVFRILNFNRCPKSLGAILRHLKSLWSSLPSGWSAGGKGGPRKGGSSSSPQDTMKAELNERDKSDALAYTTVRNGKVIALEGIACSVYPHGKSIHSTSKSSQILQDARSAHLAVSSRPGSRLSFASSNSSRSRSFYDETPTIEVQPAIESPDHEYSNFSPDVGRAHSFLNDRAPSPTRVRTPEAQEPSSSFVETLALPGTTLNVFVPSSISEISEIPNLDQRICPVIPEGFQRYQKREIITKKKREIVLPRLTTKFLDFPDPPGWTRLAHPEGAAYFYHEKKRIFTDTNLHNQLLLGCMNEVIKIIEDYFTDNELIRPPGSDLVLDLNPNTDLIAYYYFADHTSRVIFFLDDWDTEGLSAWNEVAGVTSLTQIRSEMEAQYWYHCQTYPDCLQLTLGTVCELRDNVMHLIGDCMTSPFSTSPYTLDDLHKILALSNSLEKNAGRPSMGSMTLICRFFYIFARARFLNFHGTPAARLERDHSVYGTVTRRTWLIKTLSIFLFSAPDVHLRVLQKLWVDELLHKGFYEEAMKKMDDEWQEFILFATVLLNANVAFLTIQSVDVGGPDRSGAQISSYVSVFMSVGSIILGLLLVRQSRTKNRDSAADVQQWLQNRSHPLLGLETLAIMFSLPYALLMWGMVFFLCSFSFMAFQCSSILTVVIVGLCGIVIGSLIVWCIVTSWEKQPEPEAAGPPPENNDEPREIQLPPLSASLTRSSLTPTFPPLPWRRAFLGSQPNDSGV